MSTKWRKAMLYLGLGPDEEYEDDIGYAEPQRDAQPAQRRESEPAARAPRRAPEAPRQNPSAQRRPAPDRPAPARPAPDRPAAPSVPAQSGRARSRPAPPERQPEPAPQQVVRSATVQEPQPKSSPAVRQVPAAAKPYVLSPETFNHAQEVADRFKARQPVILNLQSVDRDLARRLIDFCSGLCYAVGGHMEKVATQVYLLTPEDVQVSAEERRRLRERGLHDA